MRILVPRCFEIESRLRKELDIPVFHDDQHGTAIVVSAGLLNALRLVGKKMEDVNIVINGAGSAGISIAKLLLQFGAGNIVLVDRAGAVSVDEEWLNPAQRKMAEITNRHNERGSLADVMKGKDVFIGVSAPKIVTAEMVSTMAKDAIVFAMANPTPEIMPEEAAKGGARVIATGRSDYPNQINNVLWGRETVRSRQRTSFPRCSPSSTTASMAACAAREGHCALHRRRLDSL